MPESFDYATTDPGAGGENLAGDRLTQGADTLFVPAAYLVHGAAGGPYTRVEAGAGLPVAAAQSGAWTVAVSGGVTVANAGTFAVQAAQSGAWAVTAHAGTGPWPVTDNAGSLTVDDGGGSLTVDAASLPLPTGAAAEATLAALSAKVTACDTGAVVVASGAVTVSATDLDVRSLSSLTDSVAAVQSGAWSVGVSGTVDVSAASLPLPTGAATEATLSALNGKVTACNTGAVVIASGAVTVSATNLDIRDLSYTTDSVSVVQGGGNWLVMQNGTWETRVADASGNLATSHAAGAARGLDVCVLSAAGGHLTAFPVTDNSGSLTVDDGGTTLSIDDGGGAITVDGTVAVSGTVAVRDATATSTLSNVSGSASSVTLLSANADRVLAVIVNDSTADLYVKFGTTASATSYSYLLGPADTLEVERYTGRIDGIWTSATGAARVTEVD